MHISTLLGIQGNAMGQLGRSSDSHRHTLTTRNQKYGTEYYGKGIFSAEEETGVPGEIYQGGYEISNPNSQTSDKLHW